MTEKGKAVYERLKSECLPNIHKISIDEKHQLLKENAITTNLPSSFWNKAASLYENAEWEKEERNFEPSIDAKCYLFLRCDDINAQKVEYLSVLYTRGDLYAEMGFYDVSDFVSASNSAEYISNIDVLKEAYRRRSASIDEYKYDTVTYSLRNPSAIYDTRVSADELSIMLKTVNIPEYEVELPSKAKHEVHER